MNIRDNVFLLKNEMIFNERLRELRAKTRVL